MLHGSIRPGVAGSQLTHLLATLSDAMPTEGRPAFAERLGQWLSWTDAISLSNALTAAPQVPAAPRCAGEPSTQAVADVERVRETLDHAITAALRDAAADPGADFAVYRRHCQALQQTLQESVAALRRRLRDRLARQSPGLAQLAAVDAVMDNALAAQERSLLGLVPLRLQSHFERLQRAAAAGDATWRATFSADMHALLRAELDHRLTPALGLLAALRSSSAS
jgi:hypothetical protein